MCVHVIFSFVCACMCVAHKGLKNQLANLLKKTNEETVRRALSFEAEQDPSDIEPGEEEENIMSTSRARSVSRSRSALPRTPRTDEELKSLSEQIREKISRAEHLRHKSLDQAFKETQHFLQSTVGEVLSDLQSSSNERDKANKELLLGIRSDVDGAAGVG